jgi:hypothetical protein
MPRSSAKSQPRLDRRGDRVLTLVETCALFNNIDRTTLHRRRKRDPRFPAPAGVRLNKTEFWESDIYAYLDLIQREPPASRHNDHFRK